MPTFADRGVSRGQRNGSPQPLISVNTAVNQRAETEGCVMSECEGNNSDSIVTTEVGVGMSARQLQDLLTKVFQNSKLSFRI